MSKPERLRHGLTALKGRISARGMSGVDKRSAAYRAVKEWRAAVLDALGGEDHLTPQQLAIVDELAISRLLLNHVNAFLLELAERGSLIDRKKKAIRPILRERTALLASLGGLLQQIGLGRVEKDVLNAERLAEVESVLAERDPRLLPAVTPKEETT